ncbi:uncharacterized protein [Dermacentor albipictus]|uniref:uncharacterized protein isoform X9 n=1 Tax=Dermacentor albipictus TaxID=60249 RepID=UPI0038FD26E3
MAEERVNEHTPPVFSFTDEETLSANRENTRGASSSLGTYPTISDDAWRYHWNTQPRPITDRTYSVDGVSEYGSTSYVHQPFSTSIDYATPSTSLTDMEQASAIVEGGARIFQSTRVDQWNTQYLTADVRSTDCGHVHIAESGITSSLPMVSSSSINHAQPSTSRACMEKASAIPENLASISDDAWLYQWNTQQRRITDWTYNVDGVTDKGNTSYLHLGSSTSIDHAMSIISRTGMEQAPAITESGARIPETTRVDLWNTQYHLADSTSTDCGRAYRPHRNRKHGFHTSGLQQQPSGQNKLRAPAGTIGHLWELRLEQILWKSSQTQNSRKDGWTDGRTDGRKDGRMDQSCD